MAVFRFYALSAQYILTRQEESMRELCDKVDDTWCLLDNDISLVEYAQSTAWYAEKKLGKKSNKEQCQSEESTEEMRSRYWKKRVEKSFRKFEADIDSYLKVVGEFLDTEMPSFADIKAMLESQTPEDLKKAAEEVVLSSQQLAFLANVKRNDYLDNLKARRASSASSTAASGSGLEKRGLGNGLATFGQFLFGTAWFVVVGTGSIILFPLMLFVSLLYAGIVGAVGGTAGLLVAGGRCCLAGCATTLNCVTCNSCCGMCKCCTCYDQLVNPQLCTVGCRYPAKWAKGTCKAMGASAAVKASVDLVKNIPKFAFYGFKSGKC